MFTYLNIILTCEQYENSASTRQVRRIPEARVDAVRQAQSLTAMIFPFTLFIYMN